MISLPAVLGLTNSEHQEEMEPTAEQHHRVKKDEFEKVQVSLPHLFDQIFEAAFDRHQQGGMKGTSENLVFVSYRGVAWFLCAGW